MSVINIAAPNNMIKQQLRTSSVIDERVLAVFESTPRQQFVPETYRSFAYSDMQIPLPNHHRMMTPTEEGKILQSLQLKGYECVLEIGTGTGYLTALLSQLCRKVITIEWESDLAMAAQQKFQTFGYQNIESICGNAYKGWPLLAPYDCIIFTGSIPRLDQSLFIQLNSNGKLFAPVGSSPAIRGELYTMEAEKTWKVDFIFDTCLPALVPVEPNRTFIF